jgi:hypothetical protein
MLLDFNGADQSGTPLTDGRYIWTVRAEDVVGNAMEPMMRSVTIDRSAPKIGALRVGPAPFVPHRDRFERIRFHLSEAAKTAVSLMRSGHVIRHLGPVRQARRAVFHWRGTNDAGRPAKSGNYRVVVYAMDNAGNPTTVRGRTIKLRRR